MDRGAWWAKVHGVPKSRLDTTERPHFLSFTWNSSSQARDWTHIPCFARQILNNWTTRETPVILKGYAPPTSGLISTWYLAFDRAMGALALQENVLAKFSGCCADCRRQEGPCEDRLILLQVTPLPLSRLRPWTHLFVGFAANFNWLFKSVLPVAPWGKSLLCSPFCQLKG